MRCGVILSGMVMAALLGTGPVRAADWSVLDLGRTDREAHCMAAAAQTFQNLLGEMRIGNLYRKGWVTYADDINGNHDALITCTFGDNRGTRATLVIYSSGRPIDAVMLTRRISSVFERQASQIAQDWRNSFK